MTLHEFIVRQHVLLERFGANWKAQHEQSTDDWPLEMNEADWEEQFLMMIVEGDEE